jgi:two-component sensor histidine kinase
VSDNGVGLPQSVDPFNTKSLGLQLVTTLAQQLDGTPTFERTAGCTFVLFFTETRESLPAASHS